MKQADAAESNEEANKLNGQAVDLRVANSKLDGRLQQLDYQSHSLMQDMKKVGPNLKDVRLKLNRNWIPVWLKKPIGFPANNEDAELPPERSSDSGDLSLHLAIGIHRSTAETQARKCRTRKRII